MKCFTISLPDEIVQASNDAAKALGISRTEFIRQAVIHELSNIQTDIAQKEIIKVFNSMKMSSNYMSESEEMIDNLNSDLPEEEEEWWNEV